MNEAFSPITIVENNVTITLERLIVNKTYDCSKCFYQDHKEDICSCIKNTAINPKACSNLCAVEIVVHIVNASDQRFDPSHWIMIDSEGYKFDSHYLCDDFLPRRYETCSEVLPGTQSRQIYVFSELEDGIFPSSFILHIPNKKDLTFPIKPLNDNVLSLLQPPKPRLLLSV